MRFRQQTDDSEQLSLTPMIDCVFLLLIFFIVTASLKKPHKELEIDLTAATTSHLTRTMPEELVVTINKQGQIYTNGQGPRSNMEFLAELQRLEIVAPDTHVRIDVDRMTPGYHVVKLLDTLQHYHFRRVGFRTKD